MSAEKHEAEAAAEPQETEQAEAVEAPEVEGGAAPEPSEEPVEAPPVAVRSDLSWYVVQTYSGFETRVQQSLEERIKAAGIHDKVPQVMVPSEEVLEIKSGKKRKSSRKFFPGYVLVQADMTDEVWHLIKDVPKVTGFVGGRRPQPLEPDEVGSLLYQLETGVRPPRATADFSVGDKVRIIEGPFSGFVASVDEVIESQSKLKVMVTIFGRSTPVELGFLQVEAAA
jgi:transcriptional antiterminator NusG